MEFCIGDLAVYPGYGVGKIVDIESKEIMGSTAEFLAIELLENGSKLLVPKGAAEKKGLRPLISETQVPDVMSVLTTERTIKEKKLDTQTWNRRHREYTDKIKSGAVNEIATVMRDLCILRVDKELSFSERKMLDQAKGLLVKELSIAKGSSENEIEQEMEGLFPPAQV
ncbi:MAG: CarD family transcriptional regulator [Bdellovibrionales bacterium]